MSGEKHTRNVLEKMKEVIMCLNVMLVGKIQVKLDRA